MSLLKSIARPRATIQILLLIRACLVACCNRVVEHALFVLIGLDAAGLVQVWLRNVTAHASPRLVAITLVRTRYGVLALSERCSIVAVEVRGCLIGFCEKWRATVSLDAGPTHCAICNASTEVVLVG
jgi:hypothetical protein